MQYISTYIKNANLSHTHTVLYATAYYCYVQYSCILFRVLGFLLQRDSSHLQKAVLPTGYKARKKKKKKLRTFGGNSRSRTPFKQSYNLISSSVIFRSLFFARRLERVIGTYIKSQRKKWKNHK